MTPVLVLTHGDLAREILRAAQVIEPELEQASAALSLPWETDCDEASKLVKAKLRELDQGGGVLVLTDMFGGTATNLALPFLEPDKVEIVTGVNLPMLVKLGTLREFDLSLADLAERLSQAGQKSIRTASEFLRQRGGAR